LSSVEGFPIKMLPRLVICFSNIVPYCFKININTKSRAIGNYQLSEIINSSFLSLCSVSLKAGCSAFQCRL